MFSCSWQSNLQWHEEVQISHGHVCMVFVHTLLWWSSNTFSLIVSSGGTAQPPALAHNRLGLRDQQLITVSFRQYWCFLHLYWCDLVQIVKSENVFFKSTLNLCDAAHFFETIIRHSKIGPYHAIACHTTLFVLQTCCRIGCFLGSFCMWGQLQCLYSNL